MDDLGTCVGVVCGDCVRTVFVRCCGHKFWSSERVASRVLAILADEDAMRMPFICKILKSMKDHLPSCLSAEHRRSDREAPGERQ